MVGSKTSKAVVYVSAFDGDGTQIEVQLGKVRRLLPDGGCPVVVVDLGWSDEGAVCPPGLFGILKASRVRDVEMVAVETVGRFARDRTTAMRIAAILSDAGVHILEAGREGNGLAPSPMKRLGAVGKPRGKTMPGPAAD